MAMLYGSVGLGGRSMGGYPIGGGLGAKAKAGLAQYHEAMELLKSRGVAAPRAAYNQMKGQGMALPDIIAYLRSGSRARAPARAAAARAPAMRRRAPAKTAAARAPAMRRRAPAKAAAAAPARRRRAPAMGGRTRAKKCPTCHGSGFWGDVWDGVKDVASVAAPLLPLVL